jgi:hypothetical protein
VALALELLSVEDGELPVLPVLLDSSSPVELAVGEPVETVPLLPAPVTVEKPELTAPVPTTGTGATVGTPALLDGVLKPAGLEKPTGMEVTTDGWLVSASGIEVTTDGWVVTASGIVVTADCWLVSGSGFEVKTEGMPVTTPRESV